MEHQPTQPRTTAGSIFDAVLAAYRRILNNPAVTAQDDFFELGGDSLLAMDATALIQELTGIDISVGIFFTYPTAAELAAAVLASGTR